MSRINVIFCGATYIANTNANGKRVFFIGSTSNNYSQPFMFKKDLQHFKQLTKGKIIIMGKNTWLAIGEKPLPDRTNVVITSNPQNVKGALTFGSINEVLDYFEPDKELFFIGGAMLIQSLASHYEVDTFYITTFLSFTEEDISLCLDFDGYKPELIKSDIDKCIVTENMRTLFFEKYTKL